MKTKQFNTVGVRFLFGFNLDKIYTYRVPKRAKLHLGQLVVPPPNDERQRGLAAVVEIHETPKQHEAPGRQWKLITEKVAPI